MFPLTRSEVIMLATYNSEKCRGVVHTDYWERKMTALQGRFNVIGFKRPEKRKWWQFWKGSTDA